jgi:lipoprotein Spr
MRNLYLKNNLLLLALLFGSQLFGQRFFRKNKMSNDHQVQKAISFIDHIEILPAESGGAFYEKQKKPEVIKSSEPLLASVVDMDELTSMQFKYALLMNTEVESINNLPLYKFIDEWWGTPYHYGGNDRSGIDCSSFSGRLYSSQFNVQLPRTAREQFGVCEKVSSAELQQGDLVFFNTRGGVSHVGVYLGNQYFVHSSTRNGVIISSLTEDYYSKTFIGGGRYKPASNP